MLRKANWDKTLQKSLKFSYCRKSIGKQIRPSCRKNLSTSFCVCLVSWKQWNLEIRANVPKSCRRPVVSLLYATKSAFTAPNLLGKRTCLPCHIPDRWSRNANRIWPDLTFGFFHKRSGNEIIVEQQTLPKHLGMPTKHFLLTLTSGMSAFRYNTLLQPSFNTQHASRTQHATPQTIPIVHSALKM